MRSDSQERVQRATGAVAPASQTRTDTLRRVFADRGGSGSEVLTGVAADGAED
jgi:hypothetical protein